MDLLSAISPDAPDIPGQPPACGINSPAARGEDLFSAMLAGMMQTLLPAMNESLQADLSADAECDTASDVMPDSTSMASPAADGLEKESGGGADSGAFSAEAIMEIEAAGTDDTKKGPAAADITARPGSAEALSRAATPYFSSDIPEGRQTFNQAKTDGENIGALPEIEGPSEGPGQQQEKAEIYRPGPQKKPPAGPLVRAQGIMPDNSLGEAESAQGPDKTAVFNMIPEQNREAGREDMDTLKPASDIRSGNMPNIVEGRTEGPKTYAAHEGPRTNQTMQPREGGLVLTRNGDESIEVAVEPEGMGRLDIKLELDNGMINARIKASDYPVKEMIARNIHGMIDNLASEGLNIGGLEVSMRQGRNHMEDAQTRDFPPRKREYLNGRTPAAGPYASGIISIFV